MSLSLYLYHRDWSNVRHQWNNRIGEREREGGREWKTGKHLISNNNIHMILSLCLYAALLYLCLANIKWNNTCCMQFSTYFPFVWYCQVACVHTICYIVLLLLLLLLLLRIFFIFNSSCQKKHWIRVLSWTEIKQTTMFGMAAVNRHSQWIFK